MNPEYTRLKTMSQIKKSFWTISGQNYIFDTLTEAKWFVEINFTPNERIKYLRNAEIAHHIGDDIVSVVDIRIDLFGTFAFSKIHKLI